MKFTEFNLDPRILEGIQNAGFTDCTPVQEQTYGYSFEGKDICVQSQTGTGKTAAFLITIFQNKCAGLKPGMALVVVPTRELAVQIEDEARLLGSPLGIKAACIYGGVGYRQQEDSLEGEPDIIIGTPGRLIDFCKTGKLDFARVSTLVIDEADRLFDMGFIPDLKYMLKKMPPPGKRMTMLFSATLSSRVRQLAWEYMQEPAEVAISPENVTVELINQELYHVSKEEKLRLLLGIIAKENPENALIFTNTKHMAEELAWRLSENGFKAEHISGDLPQNKRLQVLKRLKAGDLQFLVATDVAARGLHIEELALVVNYDIPEDFENYVHRIGRTARAGKSGKAVTLACEKYVYGLEAIEEYIHQKIPVLSVSDDLLKDDATAGRRFYHADEDDHRRDRPGAGRGRRDSGDRPSRPAGRGPDRDRGPNRGPDRRPDRRPDGPADLRELKRRKEIAASVQAAASDKPAPFASGRRPTEAPRPALERDSRQRNRDPRRSKEGAPVPAEAAREEPGSGRRPPVPKSPGRQSGTDERLAYYRKKYGDNYQRVNGEAPLSGPKPPKPETPPRKGGQKRRPPVKTGTGGAAGKGTSLTAKGAPAKEMVKVSEAPGEAEKPKKKGFFTKLFKGFKGE